MNISFSHFRLFLEYSKMFRSLVVLAFIFISLSWASPIDSSITKENEMETRPYYQQAPKGANKSAIANKENVQKVANEKPRTDVHHPKPLFELNSDVKQWFYEEQEAIPEMVQKAEETAKDIASETIHVAENVASTTVNLAENAVSGTVGLVKSTASGILNLLANNL